MLISCSVLSGLSNTVRTPQYKTPAQQVLHGRLNTAWTECRGLNPLPFQGSTGSSPVPGTSVLTKGHFECTQHTGVLWYMASISHIPDPAELYIARLGTEHSRATVRSALRAVARLLNVNTIDWAALTYADLAGVRAGLNRYSVSWGNTCWTVSRQVLVEARRLGIADPRMVDDVLALPRLRGSSGRLGRDLDDNEVTALLAAVAPDSTRNRRPPRPPRLRRASAQ